MGRIDNVLENGMKKFLLLCGLSWRRWRRCRPRPRCRWMSPRAMSSPCPSPFPISCRRPSQAQAGANIAHVVRADLERSGLFTPLDPKAFVDHITNINTVPNFANWRVINAQGLVTGEVTLQPDGRLRVDFRLWDVYGESQMLGQQFFTQPENWRRVAHMVSDAIYERITGEKGYFDTRIVFISETGPAIKRVKRLAIMDEDGANPIFLTRGDYLVLTPRFNPTAQMIAYMSYIGTKPRVYLFDIETGKQEMLGNFPNMTFSPRFSPDGNQVALTLETAGNSDIYVMDLRTRAVTAADHRSRRSTPRRPSRPTASQIAFESDRGGSPADLCDECGRLEPAPHQLRRGRERHPGLEPRAAT